MRILAIAVAGLIGIAGSSAWAGCDWSTAKANDVLASATSSTPSPAPATPVKLPEADEQS